MPEMVTPEELAIINERFAKEPLAAAYCIPMMAADTERLIDSRALKLHPTTIAKFAKDAQEKGPNLQLSHASFLHPIPIGKVFAGTDANGKLYTKSYMPVGVAVPNLLGNSIKTDEVAAAYAAGLVDKVSIGFSFERAECNLCHEDVRSPSCPHTPGQSMEVEGQPVECTPIIFAGTAGELDHIGIVFQGALGNAKTVKRSDLPEQFSAEQPLMSLAKEQSIPELGRLEFSVQLHSTETLALMHNSMLAKTEPAWGDVDKTKLPRSAFAGQGKVGEKSSWSYPHHFVQNGGGENAMGCYTTGEMYLSRSGLRSARAAASGARSGHEADAATKAHLDAHAKDIGMGQNQLALLDEGWLSPEHLENPLIASIVDRITEEEFGALWLVLEAEAEQHVDALGLIDALENHGLSQRLDLQAENIGTLMARVAALEPIAAIGTVYMESVKASALAAGVKLMGNAFNADFYEKVFGEALAKGEVGVVQQAAEAWGSELTSRFPAGRQTIEPDPARSEATVTASTPDAQFDQLVRATLKAEKWEFDRYGDAAIAVGKAHPDLVAAMRAQTAPSHAE